MRGFTLGKKRAKSKNRLPRQADMPNVQGMHYIDLLAGMHASLKPKWYLEIGTQSGQSLRVSKAHSIAIDPEFKISEVDILNGRDQTHLFSLPSDDFFASSALSGLGAKIDFAFLDGMHLIDFLLRDFINVEKQAVDGTIVTIHDCMPWHRIMAKRTWDRNETVSWTGDVWKILPILREWRPELDVSVADARPTGLVVVRGLNAYNDVLSQNYDAIMDYWLDQSLDDYGVERLRLEFPLVDPDAVLGGLAAHVVGSGAL